MTVVLIGLWQYASTRLNPIFFPSPAKVMDGVFELVEEGTLLLHIRVSLVRILAGFFIGTGLAIPTGLLMGTNPFIRRVLTPYVGFLRFIRAD